MVIECIPVPKEKGDLAPMYFKVRIAKTTHPYIKIGKIIVRGGVWFLQFNSLTKFNSNLGF